MNELFIEIDNKNAIDSAMESIKSFPIHPHRGCILCPLFRECKCIDCIAFLALMQHGNVERDWLSKLITSHRNEFTWDSYEAKNIHAKQQLRNYDMNVGEGVKNNLRNYIGGHRSIPKIYYCNECFCHIYGRGDTWRKALLAEVRNPSGKCITHITETKSPLTIKDIKQYYGEIIDGNDPLLIQKTVGLSNLAENELSLKTYAWLDQFFHPLAEFQPNR
jgi:hypothetical protein